VVFELLGTSFFIPGYMVWSALFYAGVASWASWRVGRPLIQLNAERYARESDLRFALVPVNEHSEGIAVHRGEAGEKSRLQHELDSLLVIMRPRRKGSRRGNSRPFSRAWATLISRAGSIAKRDGTRS
jgi:putative ATP-binding cassette transporter